MNHIQSCFPFILFISAYTSGPPHFSLLKIGDPVLTSKSAILKRPKAISKSWKNDIASLHLNFHLLLLFFLFPIKAVGGSYAFGLLPYIFSFCLFRSFLAHSGTRKQCGWQKGSFHHFINSAFFFFNWNVLQRLSLYLLIYNFTPFLAAFRYYYFIFKPMHFWYNALNLVRHTYILLVASQ